MKMSHTITNSSMQIYAIRYIIKFTLIKQGVYIENYPAVTEATSNYKDLYRKIKIKSAEYTRKQMLLNRSFMPFHSQLGPRLMYNRNFL